MNDGSGLRGQIDATNAQGVISPPMAADEVEWNLVDAVHRVVRGRRTLLLYMLVGLVLGVAIAWLWPRWYEAQAVFLPPETQQTSTPTAASLQLLKQDPSDMYLGMLGSRSVADDVIDRAGLMKVYHARTRAAARAALSSNSKFLVSKNSLISVTTTARDPKLAAEIANAYLDALYHLNGTMVASASDHRRAFFEDQLESEKNSLSAAEVELKNAEEKTGIVLPAGEAEAGLRATAELQARIGAAQARLSGLEVGATAQNPRVIQAQAELAELKAQLVRQQASSKTRSQGTGLASSAELPGMTLELMRKLRDVKLRELVYDSLTQQYEKARIESLDPGPQFQIVDRAVTPEQKAGPPRKWIVLGGIVLGFLAGLGNLLFAGRLARNLRKYRVDPVPAVERQ